jgi:hypothetical protein
LSFILAGTPDAQNPAKRAGHAKIRIISDCFPLSEDSPGARGREKKWGRYGCSEHGLVLVSGSRRALESSPIGKLEELPLESGVGLIDAKSGAYIAVKS